MKDFNHNQNCLFAFDRVLSVPIERMNYLFPSLTSNDLMKISPTNSIPLILSLVLITVLSSNALGQLTVDSGTISAMEPSGGGFLAGTSTFDLAAADIQDLELLANFDIIDAGIDITVNGVSLYPQFQDYSQFSQDVVFLDTGVPLNERPGEEGNIQSPFSPNNNNLPRLTVESTSDGTEFSGGATTAATSTIPYTPNFVVQDFTSLLVEGQNTIQFFVLNDFQGANLQGDYTVSLNPVVTSVPEPSATCFAFLAIVTGLLRRDRKMHA